MSRCVLHYVVTVDQPWLSVYPTSGLLDEFASANLEVTFNTSTLPVGAYSAKITIADTIGYNSPVTIPVTLSVYASRVAYTKALRLYAFSRGKGEQGDPIINAAATLPVALPFVLSEVYVFQPIKDPGVLWLTEELPYDEVNARGSAVLPFLLPAELASTEIREDIQGQIRTRRYDFGTFQKKRYSRGQIDIVLYDGSAATGSITTVNPDTEATLFRAASENSEDFIRRVRVARQGQSAELVIRTTQGRASIRGVSLDAVVPGTTTKSEE